MGSLLTSLRSAAGNLQVYDRALALTQSNVANANTPGYVKQTFRFQAGHFQPELGDTGGVVRGIVLSSRDRYAEQAVREGQQQASFATQAADSYARLEGALPIGAQAAIPKAIDDFFSAVSQWSVNPNNTSTRQPVLNSADQVALAVRGVASTLANQTITADRQIQNTVNDINAIAKQIQSINARILSVGGLREDPALDAEMHAALEQLSQYMNITAVPQDDGSVSVLVAGQQSLVIGDHTHPLSAALSNNGATIQDDQGNDVTGELTGGKIGALLASRNVTLPGARQQLNQLAQAFADQINAVLRNGLDQAGSTPSVDLFAYNSADPARTLVVNSLTPAQLAGASAGAVNGNGNVLQLSALSTATVIQNQTFTGFYAELAAQVGRQKSAAGSAAQSSAAILTQTQALREQASSVSLDEEASHLITLQRGYQAIAKMVTTLDELTQSVIEMLR